MITAIGVGAVVGVAGVRLATASDAPQSQIDQRASPVSVPLTKSSTSRLLELLDSAAVEGLAPERYSVSRIKRELAKASDTAALERVQRLLLEIAGRYAADLRVPRRDLTTVYVDPELAPVAPDTGRLLSSKDPAMELGRLQHRNPMYLALRAGLQEYRARWSSLPQHKIPPGPTLHIGDAGPRVALLRQRLGLRKSAASALYDRELANAVQVFRRVHGLGVSTIADPATVAALNLGSAHYERLLVLNLDRVRGLPSDGRRYIVVDTAGARLRMFDQGREVDTMRVVAGKQSMQTPQLAGLIRFAIFDPYWNVPPDLVQHSVAPQVLRHGAGYLEQRRFILFSDWRSSAQQIGPKTVDWSEVAAGRQKVWVRQLPGRDNMMGKVKFMLPNRLGIYLHDTPHKADFHRANRHLSSGCVRVEDAARLARWLFGSEPLVQSQGAANRRVDLRQPVPVYITYLTAVTDEAEARFQPDVYGRDRRLLITEPEAVSRSTTVLSATAPDR